VNVLVIIVALVLCLVCGWLEADVYLTQPQAIQAAFHADAIERKTLFLNKDQIEKIETLARVKMDSSIVSYYVARNSTGVTGVAFFDRRIMRTMPVTYMTVIKPTGDIDHIDILSFEEPLDYLPPARWLALYKNRGLDNDLTLGHAIPHITGASLSSQAMNDGIRLMLAIFHVGVKGTF
jgi:electron transport complex protein RnfG